MCHRKCSFSQLDHKVKEKKSRVWIYGKEGLRRLLLIRTKWGDMVKFRHFTEYWEGLYSERRVPSCTYWWSWFNFEYPDISCLISQSMTFCLSLFPGTMKLKSSSFLGPVWAFFFYKWWHQLQVRASTLFLLSHSCGKKLEQVYSVHSSM